MIEMFPKLFAGTKISLSCLYPRSWVFTMEIRNMWIRRNQIVRKLTLGVVTTVLGMSLSFSALSATPVETHGQLSIENGRLVDRLGKRVQLRGSVRTVCSGLVTTSTKIR